MFQCVTSYLREQGWKTWSVAQIETDFLVWWIFRPGESSPAIVGKLPRTALDVSIARREAEALQKLSSFGSDLGIPKLLFQTDLPGGGFLFLQSGVPGRPLPEKGDYFDRILTWLKRFQGIPASGSLADMFNNAVEVCRERVRDLSKVEQQLLELGGEMIPKLRPLAACAVHGDFWTGNVLQDGTRLSVVDWSNYHFGSPLEDLHNFAAAQGYDSRSRMEDPMRSMWRVFFEETPLMRRTHSATLQLLEARRIEPEMLRPLFVLFLLRRIGCTEFSKPHIVWRKFAERYMQAGVPQPFTLIA